MADTSITSLLIQQHYGSLAASLEESVAEGKATRIILAADGTSPSEELAFRVGLQALGLPEAAQKEILDFDPSGKRIEDVLPSYEKNGQLARVMLYNAVLVAAVDGFGDAERAQFRRAGEMLGVPLDVVSAIEDLVLMEKAVTNLRHSLLKARS